jgi:hypothetical protein
MSSSGMFRRVAMVRTDDSEENITFIMMMKRISDLETTLAITSTEARCEDIVSLKFLNSCFRMFFKMS